MENPLSDIDAIEALEDPAQRAIQAGKRLEKIPDFQTRLRIIRQSAVLEMKAAGLTYLQIGEAIGKHRNRVQQIAEGRTAGGQGGDKAKEAAGEPVPRRTPTKKTKPDPA